jgi:hypothetical protein
MSAQNVIVTPIENVVVAPDAVKQKKPTLAGKFSKLLNFGFWFASMTDSEELKSQLHAQLRLFGSVEEQTELFERFSAEEKDIAKMIRKRIADHNKPPKPVKEPKAKAPRKGKAVVHQDELISQLIADANAEVAEPKPNKADEKATKEAAKAQEKAAKEAEKEAAKLAKEEAARVAKEAKEEAVRLAKEAKEEAVRLAKEAKEAEKEAAKLAKEEAAKAKATKEPKAKATKAAKSAPVVAPEPVAEVVAAPEPVAEVVAEVVDAPVAPVVEDELVADVIEDLASTVAAMAIEAPKEVAKEEPKAKKATKEPKAKAAKEPKAKAAKEPKTKAAKKEAEPAPPAEEEEEIQTRIATIGDKDYLIDQEFNVYNIEEPHDHIGTYNQETGAIDAL